MMIWRTASGILTGLLFLFPLTSSARAQQAPMGEGCVTSDCHATIATAEFVHGPVGAFICSACHVEADKKHKDAKIDLVVPASELCYFCHETKLTDFQLPVQHQPVAKGECVGCHDPHQSNVKFLLKGKAEALCYKCHTNKTAGLHVVHGPVATGNCQLCHDPHASAFASLLPASPVDACLACHQEKVRDMSMRHVHPPVEEKCTSCHNPHASDLGYMMIDSLPNLCYGCHDEVKQAVLASHDHPPAEKGECLKCHNVHASDQPRLLGQPGLDLCVSCHEREGAEVLSAKFKHGPVKQGDCTPCHDPHGQESPFILKGYFPEEFYLPYATDKYGLCFQCHNREIALNEKTKTLTDFRDGERNLHFVHVNKDEKGRSCKACHGVHSSSQAKHVRTAVPFGKSWSYPIAFTKTETGGSCVVGCHKPQEYKR